MTTLTPFRLFQICKYALNQYTSNSPLVRRAGLIKQKVQAITAKRDRKRMEDAKVGFHVEERRGWDVKPVDGKDFGGAEGVLGAGVPEWELELGVRGILCGYLVIQSRRDRRWI
jgi:hypothetical protein